MSAEGDHTGSPATSTRRLAQESSETVLARVAHAVSEPPASEPGSQTHIGPYRLLRVIGKGGMGVVYEAVQEPPGLRVALKVVRPGFMTDEMLRRFEYEASLLARLQHHGIARIHYAGIFDSGLGPQPYFAMELVDGKKLDEYLAESRSRLKLRQLVELFHEICIAIQHAHARFVVHRDLKPSNILITADGKPKVLDFGVARATDVDVQSTTLHTEPGQLVGTLPYMSPEQATGKVADVDTSSDVYALGVIGYEIFGGRMPYELTHKPLHDAVRVICEEEPSRLSSIDKSLRGDLETIVQKAMEKAKTRRYYTAGDLASDVKRFLDYEPITARPPGTWYQLGRFAKRNKAVVAGVAAVILALAAGAIVSTFFAITASRQRAEAEQRRAEADAVNKFLTEDVLEGASPARLPDKAVRDVILAKMIEPAASRVGQRFKDQPLVEAAVQNSLAQTYHAIGRADVGLPHAAVALEIRRRLLGDDHPITLGSIDWMGSLLWAQGKLEAAEPLWRESLERSRRVLGDDHPGTLNQINNMGSLLQAQGKLEAAEPLYREALERRRRVLGDDHEDTLTSINNMGTLLQAQGKLGPAEVLYREALERRRRVLGDDHPDMLISLNSMGTLLRAQGRFEAAEPLYREALERRRRVLGDDHPNTLNSINNLGALLRSRGKLEAAEPLFREGLERSRRVLGDDHPNTLLLINNMGDLLQAQGRFKEAEPLYREALERRRRVLGDDHPDTLQSINNMAYVLKPLGKVEVVEPLLREALERCRRVLGDDHPDTLMSINNMGFLLQAQGKLEAAEPLYREALERSRRVLGNDHPNTLLSINNMAGLLWAQGKLEAAEALYCEALERRRRVLGDDHPDTVFSINNLASLLQAQGKLTEAEPLFEELYRRAAIAQAPPKRAALHIAQYGPCLVKLGKYEPAIEPLNVAYQRLKSAGLENHKQTRDVVAGLAEACEHTNRPDDAARWRNELITWQAATKPTSSPTTAPN